MTTITGVSTATVVPSGTAESLSYTVAGTPTTVSTTTVTFTPSGSDVQAIYTPVSSGSGDGIVINGFTRSTALAHFNTALAAVKAGTAGARCRIACCGDSTTLGIPSSATLARGDFYPDALASSLAAAEGIPYTVASFFGDSMVGVTPDVAFSGSGAFWNTGLLGPGAGYINFTNTTDTATWTPTDGRLTGTFDRFDLIFWDNSAGPIDVTVGGNTYTVATGTGSGNLVRTTVTLSSAVTNPSTVAFKLHSGSNGYIGGMAFWNHATPSIEVYNLGIGGTTWVLMNATVFTGCTYMAGIKLMAPDLTIVNFGINDLDLSAPLSGGVGLTTTEGYATTGLTALQGLGTMDLLVMLPHPFTPNPSAAYTQAQLDSGIQGVANSLSIPIGSLYLTYGNNQTDFTSSSFNYLDPHPNATFYQDEGKRIASLISNASQAPYAVATPALPAPVVPSGWTLD